MSLNSTRVFAPALAGVGIGIAWIGTAGVFRRRPSCRSPRCSPCCGFRAAWCARGRGTARRSASSATGSPTSDASREVGVLVLTSFVVVMVGFPYWRSCPGVSTELHDVGAAGYGALSAASAIGAVAMSFWIAGRGSRRSRRRIQGSTGCCSVSPSWAWPSPPSLAGRAGGRARRRRGRCLRLPVDEQLARRWTCPTSSTTAVSRA